MKITAITLTIAAVLLGAYLLYPSKPDKPTPTASTLPIYNLNNTTDGVYACIVIPEAFADALADKHADLQTIAAVDRSDYYAETDQRGTPDKWEYLVAAHGTVDGQERVHVHVRSLCTLDTEDWPNTIGGPEANELWHLTASGPVLIERGGEWYDGVQNTTDGPIEFPF